MRFGWIGLLFVSCLAQAASPQATLAWRSSEGDQLLQFDQQRLNSRQALPAEMTTPLGSLWKLFVYSWLVDTGQQEPPYQCRGHDSEERYCCSVGQRIERDDALVKSCGLYFEPARLNIDAKQWRDYWQAHQVPGWVGELVPQSTSTTMPESSYATKNAAQKVPVHELLTALQKLPAQQQARRVLLDVTLAADERRATSLLGGRLRIKTWSWHRDDGALEGGFAGWLLDGTPLWLAGPGTSRVILANYGKVLGELLPTPWPSEPGQCVTVPLFVRYPAQEVLDKKGKPAAAGQLKGRFEVRFDSGHLLDIESQDDIFLLRDKMGPRLIARISEEEYVARVLDREASPEPAEAAKALAVTIRTYLHQNAQPEEDCLTITDSTQHQRVAPRPATHAARQIAAWSAGLTLQGGPVTYHAEQGGAGKLSWRQAVAQAKEGLTFDLILARAFPYSEFSRAAQPASRCQPLPEAERWLLQQRMGWRTRLSDQAGYEEPEGFAVCLLGSGRPYADKQRQRIYVRGLYTLQDRLDLAHEYLHLAFQSHPNGLDEAYVERWARHLIME